MREKSLRKIIAFTVIAGALMSLFDLPYASIILISGLAAFLLLKLIKLVGKRRSWTSLHFIQLLFILIALGALVLRYYEYPYSRAVFAVALLTESLVGAKIFLNEKFGSSNVNNFARLLKNFLMAQRQQSR